MEPIFLLFLAIVLLIVVISKLITLKSSIEILRSELNQISESLVERSQPSSAEEDSLPETPVLRESKTEIPIDPVLPESREALQDPEPIPEKSISSPHPLPDKKQEELLAARIEEALEKTEEAAQVAAKVSEPSKFEAAEKSRGWLRIL